MSKRTAKRSAKQKKTANEARSQAIELSNGKSAGELAEKKLRKYLKELGTAERSLDRFEKNDLLEFEQWQRERFGKDLDALHELEGELYEKATFVDEVESMYYVSDLSYRECYEEVMLDLEDLEERGNAEDDNFAEEEFSEGNVGSDPDGAHSEMDAMKEGIRQAFSEMFGYEVDADDPVFEAEFEKFKQGFGIGSGVEQASSPKPDTDKPGLKKVYRSLVRKLHPDQRKEIAAFDEESLDQLWHETQEAYSIGDVEELQRIEAIIDIEINGLDTSTDIDRINQAAERHRLKLREVQRKIRQARKHPAWMFSKKPDVKVVLEYEISEELAFRKESVKSEISFLKSRIASWKRAAEKHRKRREGKDLGDDARSPVAKDKKVNASLSIQGELEF
ncbi:hypothetical protein MLD52_16500 [Puniceicoccaceae bacterium K14]|nr:hypothetical protein [Puniceicoccaceae bacterium K14]